LFSVGIESSDVDLGNIGRGAQEAGAVKNLFQTKDRESLFRPDSILDRSFRLQRERAWRERGYAWNGWKLPQGGNQLHDVCLLLDDDLHPAAHAIDHQIARVGCKAPPGRV